jgi:outer membrane lipoprotein SlyB
MFITGFSKLAATVVTLSPERYYELAREKDPYVGSLTGALTGAVTGGIKGAKGKKSKAALVGAAAGTVGGAAAGAVLSKGLKHYQAHRIERLSRELRLRATPPRPKEQGGED